MRYYRHTLYSSNETLSTPINESLTTISLFNLYRISSSGHQTPRPPLFQSPRLILDTTVKYSYIPPTNPDPCAPFLTAIAHANIPPPPISNHF